MSETPDLEMKKQQLYKSRNFYPAVSQTELINQWNQTSPKPKGKKLALRSRNVAAYRSIDVHIKEKPRWNIGN